MNREIDNKGLLKNTFILSIVQILNIVIKVMQNKVAAIALGPSGMGVVGLFSNSMQFIITGAGLGVPQSAILDIASADAQNDINAANTTYTITNRVVYFTGVLGLIITLIGAYPLSIYVFGDSKYTFGYIILSFAVFFNVVSEGKLAILKGKRRFRDLAKCTITGSIAGLLIVVPIYWIFKDGGIVFALILIALAQFFYVTYYVNKCKCAKVSLGLYDIFRGSKFMIQMGISLMIVSFVNIFFNLVVASFIRSGGNLANVGIYTAGATILTTYFNVLISAMSTDFYPRVSALCDKDKELQVIVNNQCLTCLSLLFPLVVIFVFAAPFFIAILYTGEFVRAAEYTDYAMLGTILLVCSNFLGIILLAKRKSKIFLFSVFGQRTFLLVIYYIFYNLWDIRGLGFAYVVTGLSDLLLMTIIMNKDFSIKLNRAVWTFILVILVFTLTSMYLKELSNLVLRFTSGGVLLIVSCIISYWVFKNLLGIDIVCFLRNKIMK